MRLLLVGDCHAVESELQDCEALVDFVHDTALEYKAEVLFLGDQHHNHSVISSPVMWFWRESFRKLIGSGLKVHALVGNHDYAGANSHIHAMAAYQDLVNVIDVPTMVGPVLCAPYYDDHEQFIADTTQYGHADLIARGIERSRTLICHQTFTGAQYEGGFYAPDGIDPSRLLFESIIAGHIHSGQRFSTVTYIGAPRWRTLSDANIERAIWLYEFDGFGRVVSRAPFNTGDVCRQIKHYTVTPDEPLTDALDPKHDYRIDIRGPADFVETTKAVLSRPGVKLRTFKTDTKAPTLKESDGIDVAFSKYLEKYTPRFGTAPDVLMAMAKERLNG